MLAIMLEYFFTVMLNEVKHLYICKTSILIKKVKKNLVVIKKHSIFAVPNEK